MDQDRGGGRKRRKRPANSPSASPFDDSAFPLLLAAAVNNQNPNAPRSLLRRSLRRHLRLLLQASSTSPPPSSHRLLPRGLLALLPLLLTDRRPWIISRLSAEVVGAAALCSIETNEMVALDGAVVEGLVRCLGSCGRQSSEAACNAVMDLSTTPIGRDRLRESCAVEELLSVFCQAASTSSKFTSRHSVGGVRGDSSVDCYSEDNLLALILDAAVILINTCREDFLERIPEELIVRFLPLLKEIWNNMRGPAPGNNLNQDHFLLRSMENELATAIFRLSMNRAHWEIWSSYKIHTTLFGGMESKYNMFFLECWEYSPHLFMGTSKNSVDSATIFSSLVHSFNPESVDSILNSILHGLVSCPPIASDELDILSFLNESTCVLGSPILYGQDVRVLKTEKLLAGSSQGYICEEVHFFKSNTGSKFLDDNFVEECKDAFLNGYTVALRGIEFRNNEIAAIAEGLAELFGQPSVGANIYLTPPGSQGLAQHYDDHCVFVWQLFGHKEWSILPRKTSLLPRLYEPSCNPPGLESNRCDAMQILLEEGDILYIPRGCLHEAHTMFNESEPLKEASPMFSLHITLGIEVEPPFEWEGFSHVALHYWNQKQEQAPSCYIDHKSRKQRTMLVVILHVAIRLLADADPIFRKACMVAARPLSCDTDGGKHDLVLDLNQKATFGYIIDRIDANSSFMEAFRSIEAVVQNGNDDCFQWMRWFRHLEHGGVETERVDFDELLARFKDFIELNHGHIEETMLEFTVIKSKFCRDVVFEDACKSFKLLLEKYRKTRKQYMNGMLSLHSTY